MPISDFIVEPLFTAPFGIIARQNHPLSQCSTLRQLKQARWLMAQTDMGYYQSIGKQLACIDFKNHHDLIKTDSIVTILNLILHSDYIMILAKAMATPLASKSRFQPSLSSRHYRMQNMHSSIARDAAFLPRQNT
ncbi:LysR substrate-binding domain-containing protein [Dongshaea marina]|uniref:LysR substrate-binding domain-containing protein n=1 Tax=Dongshaea marina TaxID=2047966 RepID=UPI001F2D7BC2|nr:LysR substrate-binding domain-containing protein [Dongshaea marina]